MKNRGLIAIIVVLIAVIITLLAVVFLMQMPTIFSDGSFVSKFINKKTEINIVSTSETVSNIESTTEEIEMTIPVKELTTSIENYSAYNDRVHIAYPQISGMEDSEAEEKINYKIKANAISIVPLYPISTSLQTLDIACEVKRLDEDFITIIYEGRVIGNAAKSNSTNSNKVGNSSNKKNSNVVDPYLDGFVDPLDGMNQINQFGVMPPMNINAGVVENEVSGNPEVHYNQNSVNRAAEVNTHTADIGPSVYIEPAPTAARKSYNSAIENTASNNPSIIYGFTSTTVSNVNQKIFYTNTINLKTGIDVTLKDYINDFDVLSKWLRSSKVEFSNIDAADRAEVRNYVNLTVQSRYVDQMKSADFRNEGVKSWPKIFSYKDSDGTVYFSVKLSSKLGNYAIVKYTDDSNIK